MRCATFLSCLLAVGVLSTPMKRDYVYDEVVVVTTLVVTADSEPTSSATAIIGTQPVPSHGHRHHHFHYSTYTPVQVPIVTPTPVQESPVITPSSTSESEAATSTELPSTSEIVEPTTSSTPEVVYTPPASTTPPSSTPPAPSPTPVQQAYGDGSPLSGGVSLLTTVNKWRGAYGLSHLKWSTKLEGNARKTGTDGGGVNQNHELNPGTMGQVITPGEQTAYGDLKGVSPFELSYVAWLCESSSDRQLNDGIDYCGLVSNVLHMYYTSTGHHDILCSTSYSTIGCAFAPNPNADAKSPYQGLWVCDVGYDNP